MKKAWIVVIAVVSGVGATYAAAHQQTDRVITEDCTPYSPSGLRLTERSGGTWMLERADGAQLRPFASSADARAGLAVFQQYSALCYIGRGNNFPEPYRSRYVMEYLK
jgi:hypothetical protein